MNLPTLVVAAVVALVFCAIVVKFVRDHKKGKYSCGGNCGACKGNCGCH